MFTVTITGVTRVRYKADRAALTREALTASLLQLHDASQGDPDAAEALGAHVRGMGGTTEAEVGHCRPLR